MRGGVLKGWENSNRGLSLRGAEGPLRIVSRESES